MSDRDRMLIAAAAIGLIACSLIWGIIGVGLLNANPERQGHHSYVSQEEDRPETIPRPSALALESEACANAASAADDDPQRPEKRDLCAQYLAAAGARKAAYYTELQTWIGVGGLLAVLFTLVMNYKATRAATEQSRAAVCANSISNRQFAEGRRPWLDISFSPDVWTRMHDDADESCAFCVIDLMTKNVGMSPANHVHIDVMAASASPFDESEVSEIIASVEDRKLSEVYRHGGITIFPGVASPPQGRAAYFKPSDGEVSTCFFVAAVIYRFSGSDRAHATIVGGHLILLNDGRIFPTETQMVLPAAD